jgi:hypothetical protein
MDLRQGTDRLPQKGTKRHKEKAAYAQLLRVHLNEFPAVLFVHFRAFLWQSNSSAKAAVPKDS